MEFEEHRDRVEGIVDYCCRSVKSSRGREKTLDEVKELILNQDKRCQPVRAAQIFNDSIHHTIEVNSLEKAIINTPEFFRLNDIKQLGGKFHVYCGATHTRFQHSIGVCYLAAEFIDHLKKQENDRDEHRKKQENEQRKNEGDEDVRISREEELCVRIAGLCHDLGHGPFSHLFEEVITSVLDLPKDSKRLHERLSQLMFKKLLVDNPAVLVTFAVHYGLTKEHVQDIEVIINPDTVPTGYEKHRDPKKKFLYEIVANKENGMDVDKWDYFARDFLHLGVTNEFDWRRCMKTSSIVKVGREYHIGFRDKEITNMYGMFRTRSILYVKALMHNTVQAIEMMLKEILCCVANANMFAITDEHGQQHLLSITDALQEAKLHETSPSGQADLSGYMVLTDSILHLIMDAPTENPVSQAQKLIGRLQRRDLYKCIAEETIPCEDYGKMKELKEQIQDSIKKHSSQEKEIKLVCLKFASEKSLDPVKDIYFFLKPKEPSIPMGSKVGDLLGDPEGRIKDASPLCKPEKLFEYRIRMFRKSGKIDERELEKELGSCGGEIKRLLSLRRHSYPGYS